MSYSKLLISEWADEVFMAHHIGRFINEVAKAGKAELNIPMYANAWLGLTKLLLEHLTAATPATHALIALMNFNAARLPAEPMRG